MKHLKHKQYSVIGFSLLFIRYCVKSGKKKSSLLCAVYPVSHHLEKMSAEIFLIAQSGWQRVWIIDGYVCAVLMSPLMLIVTQFFVGFKRSQPTEMLGHTGDLLPTWIRGECPNKVNFLSPREKIEPGQWLQKHGEELLVPEAGDWFSWREHTLSLLPTVQTNTVH